jgi:hypothetical protein
MEGRESKQDKQVQVSSQSHPHSSISMGSSKRQYPEVYLLVDFEVVITSMLRSLG